MAKLTIVFGVLLIVVGATGYFGTGSEHMTALIPAYFGLALCLFGGLALTEDPKKRMLWMHIAVTIGLVSFIGGTVEFFRTRQTAAPAATEAKGAMALLSLIYVVLCVRSFIAARRSRIQ